MDKDKFDLVVYEINKEIKLLLDVISSVLNKNAPVENLVKAVENFKKKRQLINNLGAGLVINIGNVALAVFKLTGDLKRDINQKDLSKEKPDNPDKQSPAKRGIFYYIFLNYCE